MAATWNGDYSKGDGVIKFAQQNRQAVRGHTMFWKSSIPRKNFDVSRKALDKFTVDYLTHFKDNIISVDVFNEIFDDSGTQFKSTPWFDQYGEEFFTSTLKLAQQTAPQLPLFINEYGVEFAGKKRDFMYATIKKWLDDGVPVHGVGLQCHFVSGQVSPVLDETISMFRKLGLQVVSSEVDIGVDENANQAAIAQQNKDFAYIAQACLKGGCSGIVQWMVKDDDSWVSSGVACQYTKNLCGKTNPGVLDNQCKRKSTYEAMVDVFKKAGGGGEGGGGGDNNGGGGNNTGGRHNGGGDGRGGGQGNGGRQGNEGGDGRGGGQGNGGRQSNEGGWGNGGGWGDGGGWGNGGGGGDGENDGGISGSPH